ncbi:hypothetical protein DBV05_g3093 [Lasiodiplodia theobromae]|uniref:Uncharacterized protein n=1 Tax=Lasiodiplodia theobromae TaxID=45133 RepID=A0A5N5DMA5_9PEZI|nr:hypothetical protein DBV05_g3093 [Lasiodiplodia theobromae]
MADKPPGLRHRLLRGRRKSSDTADTSDSASDGSRNKKDQSNSTDSRSPPQPVARPASRSPSARMPRKLQKKRSSIDSYTSSTTPSPSGESSNDNKGEVVESAQSRANARRQERRQLEPIGLGPTTTTKSRNEKESATTYPALPHDALSSENNTVVAANGHQRKDLSMSPLTKDAYEERSDDLSLMEVSPLSSNSEFTLSDTRKENSSERRKSIGSALDNEEDTIHLPEYNDPNPRIGDLTYRSIARAQAKLRTPSPVSPHRDNGNRIRDSPVSPLEDSPKASFKNQEAPLLPHERMEPPNETATSTSESRLAIANEKSGSTGSTPHSDVPRVSKLKKKPSTKSKIPTLKLNTTNLTDATGNGGGGKNKIVRGDEDGDDADFHHNAVAAENALLETLRRITSRKQPQTDTEIRAATEEVLRTAASVLDLGPRSPVLAQNSLPLPPAPEAPELLHPGAGDITTPISMPPIPRSQGNDDNHGHGGGRSASSSGGSGGGGTVQSLLEDAADGEETDDDDELLLQKKNQRYKQQQAPVGSERVRHPAKVTYERPILLAAGVAQRGIHRWKCCRCQCYTHYENHVCSKLDCLHARCESHCEAFEV